MMPTPPIRSARRPTTWRKYLFRVSAVPFLMLRSRDIFLFPFGFRGDVDYIDPGALERLTGHPVRSEYKNPGEPDVLPPPDAIIVAPATVNTVNKWALGICDTLALGLLVEAIGKRLPLVVVPTTNPEHAAHPAFAENLGKLRSWGVTVLARTSGGGEPFPWARALDAISEP